MNTQLDVVDEEVFTGLTIVTFEILDDALIERLQFRCRIRRKKLDGDIGITYIGVVARPMIDKQ